MAKTENPVKKKSAGKGVLIGLDVVIIIALALFGGFYFYKYRQLKNKPAPSALQAQTEEAKQLVQDIAEKVELPKDEEPTIYTVQDKSKVKDQTFFANAENGDKALIYSKAKVAILYRPSTKKIINVGPVNIAQATTPTVTIIGLSADRDAAEAKLNEKLKDKYKLAAKTDAKSEPTEILVVDLSGANFESAKAIAEAIGGKVGALPAGEDKPAGTDILIVAAPAPQQ